MTKNQPRVTVVGIKGLVQDELRAALQEADVGNDCAHRFKDRSKQFYRVYIVWQLVAKPVDNAPVDENY